MPTRKEYSDFIIKTLHELPDNYQDKTQEVLYQQGLLIGILSELMYSDSLVFHFVNQKLKKLKNK